MDPGCGTSSSGGEEMASPPPAFGQDPVLDAQIKKKLKKKKKKKKLIEEADLFTPPSCPASPYPFCHPGILYQVCPQYAGNDIYYSLATSIKSVLHDIIQFNGA